MTPPAIPRIEEIELPPSRVKVPAGLAAFVSTAHAERVTHTYGGHSVELLATAQGLFPNPPDAVAHPRTEDELEAVLDWCDAQRLAATPYGGGTSVVWGVNAPAGNDGAVTLDLDNLNAVLEIDETSRAGRFQAGILGPDLEAVLRPLGLTLRHFPQSFPWSTVGGWVAQWRTIKDEATAAVVDAGGTVTHHHAVGRMHRPGWDGQRPELFAAVLKAAKERLDPNGILNPGVLIG